MHSRHREGRASKTVLAIAVAIGFSCLPAAEAPAEGAVSFQAWDGGAVDQEVELGETATAAGSAAAAAMAGNPDLWGSAWAHVGRWWSVQLPDAPETRLRVEAAEPATFAPGLSVWAIGTEGPFDGGTTGFAGETSNPLVGTPHSFNAFGALGDPGTLWMAEGHGGNAKELIGYAISGPSYLGATGWGESIVAGAHDKRLSSDFATGVSGLVGAGVVELVLEGISSGWFAIYVGGTDPGPPEAPFPAGAFTLTVTSVPEPGSATTTAAAMLVVLGMARPLRRRLR
jgi:hypothetical protein